MHTAPALTKLGFYHSTHYCATILHRTAPSWFLLLLKLYRFMKFVSMSTTLTTKQKKDWAELLFMQDQYSQKDIADKVGVTEKTLGKWKTAERWEDKRVSLTTTKAETLRFFYAVLNKIKLKIEADDDGIGDSKLADMVIKYTAAIEKLETDASVAELMEAGHKYYKYLQIVAPEKALPFIDEYDGFIKEQLKRG